MKYYGWSKLVFSYLGFDIPIEEKKIGLPYTIISQNSNFRIKLKFGHKKGMLVIITGIRGTISYHNKFCNDVSTFDKFVEEVVFPLINLTYVFLGRNIIDGKVRKIIREDKIKELEKTL